MDIDTVSEGGATSKEALCSVPTPLGKQHGNAGKRSQARVSRRRTDCKTDPKDRSWVLCCKAEPEMMMIMMKYMMNSMENERTENDDLRGKRHIEKLKNHDNAL